VKFLLRHGHRARKVADLVRRYWRWIEAVRLPLATLEVTRLDYLHEVQHAAERITRLEHAITEAVKEAPATQQAVGAGLQSLRGVAALTAITLVTEIGSLSRFQTARQLMGHTGIVASEDSSGTRTRRGSITKTGNAHLRRIAVEAAWAYRHPPRIGPTLRKRQATVAAPIRAIAWKAQHRLYDRYRHLTRLGKPPQQVITAVGRELLGFIWAIGVQIEQADRTPAVA
jgi:transposase